MTAVAASAPRAKLPAPSVYEEEYRYWPWGKVLEDVAQWLTAQAPPGAHIIDYMCGTGFLLNAVQSLRPDLTLEGCDIEPSYVAFAQERYPCAVREGDALAYTPHTAPAIAVCTAGLHHLAPDEQGAFIAKIACELAPGASFIIAEEVLADHETEEQRRKAVLELSAALITHALRRNAPEAIIEAAADVMVNDLLLRGEYKRSLPQWRALLAPFFSIEEERFMWPGADASFGDVIIICRRTAATP